MDILKQNQRLFDDHFRFLQELLRKNSMENDASREIEESSFFDIESYKTLLRVTPGIIMLIDYSQHNYLYHSDNIRQLDIDINLVYSEGTAYTFSLFQPDHYNVMRNEIVPEIYKVFGEYCQNHDPRKLRIRYCNKMRIASGEYQWFMHHISILSSNRHEPVIGLKYMINIHQFKTDNTLDFHAYHINEDNTETTLVKKYVSHSFSILSCREKQIMTLLSQGKTSKQIAYELGISMHTVNNHRRNMLCKTNSANSTELISSVNT